MKRRVKLFGLIGALLLLGVAAAIFFVREGNSHKKEIKVSGNIEGDDVKISFRVAGQIIELLTDEGFVVKRGDIVARLNTDELSEIRNSAASRLKAAEYDYGLAQIDYQRAENLFKEGAVSAQQRDMNKTNNDASKAKVDMLKAELDLAQTRLDFAELASPVNGTILVKSALAGEYVQIGAPVFTAVDLDNVWVTAYVNETDLAKVKFNQPAYIITDTYPGKRYKGRISFISSEAEFTPKTIQTTEERVKLVYRIKVKADNTGWELKPGMPADAYIELE